MKILILNIEHFKEENFQQLFTQVVWIYYISFVIIIMHMSNYIDFILYLNFMFSATISIRKFSRDEAFSFFAVTPHLLVNIRDAIVENKRRKIFLSV